jgi:hypothetical protein
MRSSPGRRRRQLSGTLGPQDRLIIDDTGNLAMRCTLPILTLVAATAPAAVSAQAQSAYPVSGRWTYENPRAEGAARDCGRRYMTFQGVQRFDTGGGVPSYRNVNVENVGDGTYRIVDEFATGQIDARSSYTLRMLDADHIEIVIAGQTIPLRRCG